MRCDEPDSPAAFVSESNHPYSYHGVDFHSSQYCSSIATLASASSTSVSSDTSSQSSDDGSQVSVPSSSSDSDSCDLYRRTIDRSTRSQTHEAAAVAPPQFGSCWAKQQTRRQLHVDIPVPPELRQHPRRSSSASSTRSGCPPSLVRQSDRKVNFVDNLVDSATQIVEAIWPTSSVICRIEASNSVLPLRTFIQETLRRSRTSYSTLQVALYYLILVKPHVPEHDFTMEQPEDCHTSRVLQCGRRMFLAALILASKYLQDRNYSARAWSKISGLATQEINQNEMAFLLAVNWQLHVTNEIYVRWTDCVMKFMPPQPPSPGGPAAQRLFERQCEEFRNFVLKLTPDLENVEGVAPLLSPLSPSKAQQDFAVASPSPRFFFPSPPADKPCTFVNDVAADVTVTTTCATPKSYSTPMIMEPAPATVYTPGRLAPALGLLPTPRLTPQSSGFSTPAVSAASHLLKGSSMSLAMAQATSASATHSLDRWSLPTITSSPQSYFTTRRSSLAMSVSTASSPESMVSDSSRASRSSSISSASSLASAPSTSLKLDVQARCRYAKLCSERFSLRPTIASVPEDYEESSSCVVVTSSPESYTGPVSKDSCASALSMDLPVAARNRECDMDDKDAARALQELYSYRVAPLQPQQQPQLTAPVKSGSKRSRPLSMDNVGLHDNVRDLLKAQLPSGNRSAAAWPDARPKFGCGVEQVPIQAALPGGRKRVCCSTEAAQQFRIPSLHPAVGGMGGPGMWDGILN